MPRTRVKICGITRPEDAAKAAELGTDAIGLNFFTGPRRIDLDRARQILMILPPLVTPVGLTSGPTSEFPTAPTIREIRQGALSGGRGQLNISTFQFYGVNSLLADSGDDIAELWAVCRIGAGDITSQLIAHLTALSFRPSTIVLDVGSNGQLGGTGKKLDWPSVRVATDLLLQKEAARQFILAGGLTPDNVAKAIRIARPYAVDVSSGVEVPNHPGIKDPIKMRDFIQAAKSA